MLQPPADCADAFICRSLCRLPCLRDLRAKQYAGRGKSIVQRWHQGRHVQHRVLPAQQDINAQALGKGFGRNNAHMLCEGQCRHSDRASSSVSVMRPCASCWHAAFMQAALLDLGLVLEARRLIQPGLYAAHGKPHERECWECQNVRTCQIQ